MKKPIPNEVKHKLSMNGFQFEETGSGKSVKALVCLDGAKVFPLFNYYYEDDSKVSLTLKMIL